MRIYCTLILLMAAVAANAAVTVSPSDSVPARWRYTSDMFQTLPADDGWWREFDDPVLDTLISLGIDNNFNVAVAAHRMAMARQAIRQAKAGYYPDISISAGWNKSRTSGYTSSLPVPVENIDYFSAGIDMAWEIDLFGRVNARVRAEKSACQASHADYVGVMNSLCAQIATTYLQLRTWQDELEVARTHLESQEKVLKIAEARHEAGLVSKLDVAQAATIYNSTASTIPTMEASISAAINSIALLTGMYAGELPVDLAVVRPLPDYRRIVAVGVPVDLVRRRPDVRAAEYDVAAAAAKAGIARKDFLPMLTLDGSVGVAAHRPGDMFKSRSLTFSIAPKLSWTVFDGMARNAALASAREEMEAAADTYNLTVMTAVQEVENAMVTYAGQLRSIARLEEVVEHAQEQMTLSLDLYKQGLSDFLSVAQAQITLLQYTDSLTAARGSAAASLITLYKALGGGWTNE